MGKEFDNLLVEFLDYQGLLVVGLNRSTFERVFKALQDESSLQEIAEIDSNEVHEIQITDLSEVKSVRSAAGWSKDRVALYGCGILAFVIIFVFIIGIIAILGIIPLPR